MAAAFVGVAAVFVLSLAAPVTIDANSGIFTSKIADAKNDKGNGGGNGGGGNGGGGNAGGGNAGADNANDGADNANDGNAGGNDQTNNNNVASTDSDGVRKLPLPLVPKPVVVLAQFTTKIAKRYPADEIANLENPNQAISFFSELQDMSGQKISHRWSYGGEVAYNTSFKVRTNRWRVWSTQLLPEDMAGEWTVEIINESGEVLEVRALNFAPKDAVLAER